MGKLKIHDINTAPIGAQQTLSKVKNKYGFIPNLMGTMAESPSLLKTYAMISNFFEETTFSGTEKQLILMEVSHQNICHYCIAAHSTDAQMLNVPFPIIDALRKDQPLPDKKLESLRIFVRTVVKRRGYVTELEIDAFLDAGYSHAQLLDVLVGIGMKTISNYLYHIVDIPLDDAFRSQEWKQAI